MMDAVWIRIVRGVIADGVVREPGEVVAVSPPTARLLISRLQADLAEAPGQDEPVVQARKRTR
jgi:hypothetical protein